MSKRPNQLPDREKVAIEKVPIHLKLTLTIKGEAEYSNISIKIIHYILRQPHCPFILYVGTKKLVMRVAFENYISEKLVI